VTRALVPVPVIAAPPSPAPILVPVLVAVLVDAAIGGGALRRPCDATALAAAASADLLSRSCRQLLSCLCDRWVVVAAVVAAVGVVAVVVVVAVAIVAVGRRAAGVGVVQPSRALVFSWPSGLLVELVGGRVAQWSRGPAASWPSGLVAQCSHGLVV